MSGQAGNKNDSKHLTTDQLLPGVLFPGISWFLSGAQQGVFRVGIGGYYRKQNHVNRYSIAAPNQLQNLVVPVNHTGDKKWLKDAEISDHSKWVREHTHAMNSAYKKAPFYEFYDYRLFDILNTNNNSLVELIKASITFLHAQFKLEVELIFTDEICENFEFITPEPYPQVFEEKFGFRNQVSALDLLFNLGPDAGDYLMGVKPF